MLERVEVLGGGRAELRRGVALECAVESEVWDGAAPLRMHDLSPSGAFLETHLLLEPGEEVDVRFTPPRSTAVYWLRAKVVRASLGRRCPIFDVPGVGVSFLDLSDDDRDELGALLVGIPPRLPMLPHAKSARENAALHVVHYDYLAIELLEDDTDDEPVFDPVALARPLGLPTLH